jgi:hypothetical protein
MLTGFRSLHGLQGDFLGDLPTGERTYSTNYIFSLIVCLLSKLLGTWSHSTYV